MAIPAIVAAVAALAVLGFFVSQRGEGGDAAGTSTETTAVVDQSTTVTATVPTATVPVTAAPAPAEVVTTVPATTVAPTAAPATTPPTTPPPTTPAVASAPPVTSPVSATRPSTAPVTQPPAAPSRGGEQPVALATQPQAEAFVRDYYDLVAAGDYSRSWGQLAPEFQRGKARSYDYYVDFWNTNDVEVGDVQLVEADRDRAVVRAELRWNGARRAVLEEFTLRPGDNGELLIARQETVD